MTGSRETSGRHGIERCSRRRGEVARYGGRITIEGKDEPATSRRPLACRVFGCKWRFWAEEDELHRSCERCNARAVKRYATAEQANRYARYLDREPRPPVGLFGILSGTLIRDPDDRRQRNREA